MRFKVGDIIEEKKSYCDYLPGGRITKAKVISILDSNSHCIPRIKIRVLGQADKENIGKTINVHPEFFDFVERKNETIVIYRKGNEVVALDKSKDKKAIAKCSPEDSFDFYTGAKLAFNRLMAGPQLLNTRICVTRTKTGSFLTVGRIYEIKDGRFKNDNGNAFPIVNPITDIEDLKRYFSGELCRANGRRGCYQKTEFVEVVE